MGLISVRKIVSKKQNKTAPFTKLSSVNEPHGHPRHCSALQMPGLRTSLKRNHHRFSGFLLSFM